MQFSVYRLVVGSYKLVIVFGRSLLSVKCKQRFMDSHQFLNIVSATTLTRDDDLHHIRQDDSEIKNIHMGIPKNCTIPLFEDLIMVHITLSRMCD